jgi:hypothetical protein
MELHRTKEQWNSTTENLHYIEAEWSCDRVTEQWSCITSKSNGIASTSNGTASLRKAAELHHIEE